MHIVIQNLRDSACRICQSFFYEKKNGDKIKTFSTKKFFAFVFAFFLGIVNHLWLMFFPLSHWITELTGKGVKSTAIAIIMGVMEMLIIGSLGIYGWSKQNGAS